MTDGPHHTDTSVGEQDGRQRPLTITDQELFDRLGWFTHIRWAFGIFCLLLLLGAWHVLGLRFRVGDGPVTMAPAVNVVLLLFLCNAGFAFLVRIIRDRKRITRRIIVAIALAQALCDIAAISALAYYTGGLENAFILLVLVPLVIVTELLPRHLAYATAAVAALILNAMAWGQHHGLLPRAHVEMALPGGAPAAATGAHDPMNLTIFLTVTVFAMVFVATTIASRLRMRETELEEAYDELHRTDEAKGFFMRRAEHEMRAPLAAIHSILDALTVAGQTLDADQRRLIDRAKDRSKALMGLVSDLRRYSWLQSPAAVPMRQVCLSDLVIDTVDLFGKQAEARSIALGAAVSPAWVYGNEEMLREVVTNLVTNALQYTPDGGRIDVALDEGDRQVALTVADTGIGIGEKAKARLFHEFYRAAEAKKVFSDGSGLGLAIVHRAVTRHGGTVSADDRPEGGAVFTVRLPR